MAVSQDKPLNTIQATPLSAAVLGQFRGLLYHPRAYQARRLKSLIRRPLLPLYSLNGQYEGDPLRVLIADDGSALTYFRDLIFHGDAEVSRRGAVPSVLAPRLASADSDIVIVAANQFLLSLYRGRDFHFLPKWMRVYLPVWDHPDVMLKAMTGSTACTVRKNLRKAMSSGFTCELKDDVSWFDRFYSEIYRPYALNRFGDHAVTDDYSKMRNIFQHGMGIELQKDGEIAGGVVIVRSNRVLYCYRLGLADTDRTNREGGSVALYYYMMLLAHSWGCSGLDLGHSRPFASDGVLRFKLKWGARPLDADNGIGVFALAAPRRTPQAMRFLQANPFYEMRNRRVVLCDEM